MGDVVSVEDGVRDFRAQCVRAHPSGAGAPDWGIPVVTPGVWEARLFRDADVTAEVLLASACLPQLFPPVEINGEHYWDGGYSANPPLGPLIEAGTPAAEIAVLFRINASPRCTSPRWPTPGCRT